jgi:hypothetical protein
MVAAAPPRSPDDLARRAVNAIAQLTAQTPISDVACKQLMAFAPASPAMLDTLEAHCQKTGRAGLACTLIEEAIERGGLPEARVLDKRRRLVDMYLGDAGTPEKAMPHVELILRHDPADARARTAAQHLLSNREVASRAAELLQEVRRKSQAPSS